MSKSFEWAINRANSPEHSTLTGRDWSKAVEVDSEPIFEMVLDDIMPGLSKMALKAGPYEVELSFDSESTYSYFTSHYEFNDGTLTFEIDAMRQLAFKVFSLQTADKYIVEKGTDFKKVTWTIGNFVVLNEHVPELAPKDKPYLSNRLTVLLPLRMEVS